MIDPIRATSNTPPGWHTLTPRLVAQNAQGLVDFLVYVFAATGKYESASPTIMQIGDSKVMISEAGARSAKTAFLYVYVADVDLAHRRAIERGATSIEEPFETPYGDRRCMVGDRWGNAWQIARAAT
jgi:PhnB protein